MDVDALVADLTQRIAEQGTPERAVNEKRYLKSHLEHLGTSVPVCRGLAKALAKDHPAVAADPWSLVEACWGEGIYELRSTMAFFLEHAAVGPEDVAAVEGMLRDAHTWAIVDQVATRIVPRLQMTDAALMAWAKDDDFWIRRTAILEPLLELRAARGDPDAWAPRAEANLGDREFFIRKSIGWMLRDLGKKRPEWVADFCLRHRDRIAPLTWRLAVKHLPPGFAP